MVDYIQHMYVRSPAHAATHESFIYIPSQRLSYPISEPRADGWIEIGVNRIFS